MPVTINGTTGITTPAENTAALTVGSITGILKATSGVVSQAVAGTDYLVGGGSAITSINTAKAWVVFNGNGTVAMQKSYNVSSVTDLGTANYRVNFDTGTMLDDDYTITGTIWDVPTGVTGVDNYSSGYMYFGTNTLTPVTQTYFEFFAVAPTGAGYDPLRITIVCHN